MKGCLTMSSSLNNLYNEMNVFLANQLVLSMKIHNMHWYLKGKNFFTLHPKMDEFYAHANDVIDEVAERLLAIGGNPIASLQEALDKTTIKERTDKKLHGEELVGILRTDLAEIRQATFALIKLAEAENDYSTADYFTGLLTKYDKDLWMLASYLD